MVEQYENDHRRPRFDTMCFIIKVLNEKGIKEYTLQDFADRLKKSTNPYIVKKSLTKRK
jgi:hypothetical protein